MAWRELRRHPGRAALTTLSVVIGVAAVAAIGLSVGTARRAYREMYQAITGRVDLEVATAGGAPLAYSLLERVEKTPGVATAVPLIQRNTILYADAGRMKLIALGIKPELDSVVRDQQLVAGRTLEFEDDVLIDTSLAKQLQVEVGDEVKFLTRGGRQTAVVAGLVQPRSAAAVGSGSAILMPLFTAQEVFGAQDQLDRIQIVLADGADLAAVQQTLEAQLPVGVNIDAPGMRSPLAEETMVALENGLYLATAFSLLSAIFIVLNTFSINLSQRRQQFAVMRAIGATRQQIAALVLREAALLGGVGTLVGMAVGLQGATLLNRALGQLFQSSLPPIEVGFWPLARAAALGMGVSLLGACLPARKAWRLTPREGMSGVAADDAESVSNKAVVVGLVTLVVSIGLFVACVRGWIEVANSVPVAILMLISLVCLLPTALGPLSTLSQWLLWPVARIEASLARRQLLRHGGRTTMTIGVLFVAVATGLGLANSVIDSANDVRHWYQTAIVGDFFVRATMPDLETGLSATVPETVVADLRQIEGIEAMESLRFVAAKAADQRVIVLASRHELGEKAPPRDNDEDDGNPPGEQFQSEPPREGVTIGSVLAQRTGLNEGDTIKLETLAGPKDLPIAKVANDYVAGGLTIRMSRSLAERLLGVEGVDAYIVKADPARRAQVEQSLRQLAEQHGVLLQSYADLTQAIENMMGAVLGSLWGLLTLGLIVAGFGVANTLGMNVLEQTRELGLLRVVAMTCGQVRKTILAQAVILGLIGIAPGILAGVAMGYIMNVATQPTTGHPVVFRLHPWLLIGGFFAGMLVVLAASWIPAQRAARLPLAKALRHE